MLFHLIPLQIDVTLHAGVGKIQLCLRPRQHEFDSYKNHLNIPN